MDKFVNYNNLGIHPYFKKIIRKHGGDVFNYFGEYSWNVKVVAVHYFLENGIKTYYLLNTQGKTCDSRFDDPEYPRDIVYPCGLQEKVKEFIELFMDEKTLEYFASINDFELICRNYQKEYFSSADYFDEIVSILSCNKVKISNIKFLRTDFDYKKFVHSLIYHFNQEFHLRDIIYSYKKYHKNLTGSLFIPISFGSGYFLKTMELDQYLNFVNCSHALGLSFYKNKVIGYDPDMSSITDNRELENIYYNTIGKKVIIRKNNSFEIFELFSKLFEKFGITFEICNGSIQTIIKDTNYCTLHTIKFGILSSIYPGQTFKIANRIIFNKNKTVKTYENVINEYKRLYSKLNKGFYKKKLISLKQILQNYQFTI